MMLEVMVYGRYIDIEVMVLWTKKLTWGFGLLINMMSKLINIIHGHELARVGRCCSKPTNQWGYSVTEKLADPGLRGGVFFFKLSYSTSEGVLL